MGNLSFKNYSKRWLLALMIGTFISIGGACKDLTDDINTDFSLAESSLLDSVFQSTDVYSCDLSATGGECLNLQNFTWTSALANCTQLEGVLSENNIKCSAEGATGVCQLSGESLPGLALSGNEEAQLVYSQLDVDAARSNCETELTGVFSDVYTP